MWLMSQQRQLYTVKKAAEIMECSTDFLLGSIKSGKLKAHKRQGRYVINQHDLYYYKKSVGDLLDQVDTMMADDTESTNGHT